MFPVFKADYEEGLDLGDVLPQLYGDFCSWESGVLEPCALDDHHLDALTPLASYSDDSDGTLLPNSSSASSLDSNGVDAHDSSPAVVPCFTVAAAAEPVVPRASRSILGAGSPVTVPRAWQPAVDDGGGAAMTRQERVQRYREKRKRRTFEKTIRYEARRAYAEVRPRIKGRFATKEEVAAMKAAAGCSC